MERLKEVRLIEKKDVKEVSKFLGISEQAYYKYEVGKSEPSIEKLKKLADYYQVSLDYLVGRQFGNDLGYITDNEKNLIIAFRAMTPEIQAKTSGIIIRMLAEC